MFTVTALFTVMKLLSFKIFFEAGDVYTNLLHCHNKANTLQLLCNENIHLEAKILIKNEVGTSNISCVWVSDTFKSNV